MRWWLDVKRNEECTCLKKDPLSGQGKPLKRMLSSFSYNSFQGFASGLCHHKVIDTCKPKWSLSSAEGISFIGLHLKLFFSQTQTTWRGPLDPLMKVKLSSLVWNVNLYFPCGPYVKCILMLKNKWMSRLSVERLRIQQTLTDINSKIRLPSDLLNPSRNVAACAECTALKGFGGGLTDHLHSLQLFQTSGHWFVDIDRCWQGWLHWVGLLRELHELKPFSLPNCL